MDLGLRNQGKDFGLTADLDNYHCMYIVSLMYFAVEFDSRGVRKRWSETLRFVILDLDVTPASLTQSRESVRGRRLVIAMAVIYVMLWLNSCLFGFTMLSRYGGLYRGIRFIG